ncbi:MAG TPA: CDP-alcohol phosphatidyltransferase family protein [Pirellulaceae bacterium]|nr:CDP-alcohol phosphatidyltransferase family protein [Pirellulaceae bacterium]
MNEQGYDPSDRRPIAARELAISRRLANRVADLGASPNGISIAGMIAALVGGAAFAATAQGSPYVRLFWLAAAVLTQFRLLANMLDGMVAIRRNLASPLGELYNEVPDRISDAALLIGVGFAAGGNPLLGFGAALAAVFTAYVRSMAKAAGAPNDFCGPMAKQQRMFTITLVALYCAAAPLAWQPMGTLGRETFGLASAALAIVLVGSVFTALRRLVRAARHLKAKHL